MGEKQMSEEKKIKEEDVMNLGEWRKLTKDLPDDTIITCSGEYINDISVLKLQYPGNIIKRVITLNLFDEEGASE